MNDISAVEVTREQLAATSPHYNITLVDLPNEILTKIIFYVFAQGYPILPIITSCKSFYSSFIYIIYLSNVIHIEEFCHLCARDRFKSSTIHILKFLATHKEGITARIPVLNLHSNVSTLLINKTDTEFLSYLPLIVPFSYNLVVFNLVLNSTVLLFRVFHILPANLKVLVLRMEMTRLQLAMANLRLMDKDVEPVTELKNIEYFEISSHNCEIIVDHFHPELGSRAIPDRTRGGVRALHDSALTKLYNMVQSKTNETKVKNRMGQLIYNFLSLNRQSLLKVEIIGIDMSLVFNKESQKPFRLPRVRLISFDNTTSINMHEWIVEFQLENNRPTFRNLNPILLFHDKLAGRLYLKEAARIRSRIDDTMSELSLWRFTEMVFDGYHRVHRVRGLEY